MDITREYVPGDKFPYHYRYEHMAVTTDCVIFSYDGKDLSVLLVRRGMEPYAGEWAFPGGFLKMNESAKQGAFRELVEETGLVPSYLDEIGTFSEVDRDPRERTITIAFIALVKPSEVRGGDDALEAQWFPLQKLPPLAFDHQKILESAHEHLRRTIFFEPIGFDLMEDEFTVSTLQRLYEAILGRTFDRANFQKKLLSLGIIENAEPRTEEPLILESPAMSSPRRENHELKSYSGLVKKNIYELFGDKEKMDRKASSSATWSRRAIKYRFNRERYEQLKRKGFRLEF